MINISMVEDSAVMRRMMRTLLAPISTEIIECGDGREALAAYTAHRPDVVLMDIEMKHTVGIGAFQVELPTRADHLWKGNLLVCRNKQLIFLHS